MTRFEQELQRAAREVTLNSNDKAQMRERLVAYMEYTPMRSPTHASASPASPAWFGFFRMHHLTGALLIALLATSSTFGVSSAADDALPGDWLYPVKVKVNEPIKTAFLDTDAERLAWDRERAELRLKEASQLAAEGRLDDKRQEAVAKLFAEHTEAVVERVHEVEKDDPVLAAEVSTEFEAALDTHEAVLARLIVEQAEETDVEDDSARNLVEQVRSAAIEAGKMADEAEEEVLAAVSDEDGASTTETEGDEQDVDESVETTHTVDSANLRVRAVYRAQERAQERLVEVEGLIALLEDRPDLVEKSVVQVASAQESLAAGEQALADDDLSGAYAAFRESSASLQKVAQLLEVADLFDLELYDDVEEDGAQSGDIVIDGESVGEQGTHTTHEQERARATLRVEEVQHMLLGLEGYDETVATQANGLVRDALAHIMRGDISLALDDGAGATKKFQSALTYADRAHALLVRAIESGTVREVEYDDQHENPGAPQATTTVYIQDIFENGVHTYSGEVVSTACMSISADAFVAESYPEQVTIALTSTPTEGECEDATGILFSLDVTASAEAKLVSVTLDGKPVLWEMR